MFDVGKSYELNFASDNWDDEKWILREVSKSGRVVDYTFPLVKFVDRESYVHIVKVNSPTFVSAECLTREDR